MQEFSSISVSSYEAGSLADKLTEQSREGWSVAGIVQAGSSITAYLSREIEQGAPDEDDTATAAVDEPTFDAAPAAADTSEDASAGDPSIGAATAGALAGVGAASLASDEPSLPTTADDAGAPDEHDEPADDDAGDQASDSPADDLAGWAAGASTAEAGSIEAAAAALPEVAAEHDAGAADAGAVAGAAAATGLTGDATTEAAGATEAAGSAAGAAPAGWYADPSSRFELRYWDGTQWTEHVSRAGQQYTDPPIA